MFALTVRWMPLGISARFLDVSVFLLVSDGLRTLSLASAVSDVSVNLVRPLVRGFWTAASTSVCSGFCNKKNKLVSVQYTSIKLVYYVTSCFFNYYLREKWVKTLRVF